MSDVCQGCGVALKPNKAQGRKRVWCSERCRKRTMYSGECVDCGASTYSGDAVPPERCRHCSGRLQGERQQASFVGFRKMVEEMWAEGMTCREIGAALGWGKSMSVTGIAQMRARGYNLPHRYSAERRARMAVGMEARMAKARAARKVAA
jgi:hypothetical protein